MDLELEQTRRDRDPVDPYVGWREPPPAMTASGEFVENRELEAAAELMRVSHRLKLNRSGVDGFKVYRGYLLAGRIRALLLKRARGRG